MAKLYVVGIGPGGEENITQKAIDSLNDSELLVAYTPYLEYVRGRINIEEKETYTSSMKEELKRCEYAIKSAASGKNTAIISTGDAGLYGMAGPIFELAEKENLLEKIEIIVIPGVSAAFSAAAEVGAPLMHDTCLISLSDLLTPMDLIEKRIKCAAMGDFVIVFYNPKSRKRKDHLKRAFDIIRKERPIDVPVAIVKNAGRAETEASLTSLDNIDFEKVDMMTSVIVGNSKTRLIDSYMITPRGYENK